MVMKALDTTLLDLEGNELKSDGKATKMRDVFITALLATFPEEAVPNPHTGAPSLSGEEKAARFQLAVKITACTDLAYDFKPEDLVRLKTVVGKGYGPLVVGRVFEYLNG